MKKIFVLFIIPLLLLASCKSGGEESAAPDGTLRSANEATEDDFYFYYPDTWEQTSQNPSGTTLIQTNVAQSNAVVTLATISVMAFTNTDANEVVAEYWRRTAPDTEQAYGATLLDNNGDIELVEFSLDGVPAGRKDYTATLGNKDQRYSVCQTVCIRYGTVYIITLTVPEENFESVREAYETVLSNFHFKN